MNINSKINPFFLTIIVLLIFSRIIPHPPNFTPIIASAIIINFFIKNKKYSLLLLFGSMFISDLIIGLYKSIWVTYLTLYLIFWASSILFKKLDFKNVVLNSIISSSIFFIITNFSVWISSDLYDKTFEGLLNCYTMALPFFNNTLLSTVTYLMLFYVMNIVYKKKFRTFRF